MTTDLVGTLRGLDGAASATAISADGTGLIDVDHQPVSGEANRDPRLGVWNLIHEPVRGVPSSNR